MENKGEEEETVCDTGLVLGLNYESCSNSCWGDRRHEQEASLRCDVRSPSNCAPPGQSLSLVLSDDRSCESGKEYYAGGHNSSRSESRFRSDLQHASPKSSVSQLQGLRSKMVKREDDAAGSMETERPLSHSSSTDEDVEEGSARKKLRLTKEQSAFLEDKFKEQSTLNPRQKQALAEQLNLRHRQVEVWFQNRRARTKLKQTKADRELLMKCCETLTEENRRLQKELEELKLLKLSPVPPLLVQYPPAPDAASFTKCPSCERITGPSNGAKATGPVVKAQTSTSKPAAPFLNPFARSAAC